MEAVARITNAPWSESLRDAFAPEADWTPVGRVRHCLSASGDRVTMTARFRRPDGANVRLTIRLERRDGQWAWGQEDAELIDGGAADA